MIDVVNGFLRLNKVDPGAGGGDVFVRPKAIDAIEPTRRGCRVITPKAEWHVAHSTEDLLGACEDSMSDSGLPHVMAAREGPNPPHGR